MALYLKKEEVIEINRRITSLYGQSHFLLAEANLEHILESTEHYCGNIEDEEEKLLKKAAFLFYHLAYDVHAFTDGNKRTAFLATAQFLSLNSRPIFEVERQQEEIAIMAKDTAEGKKSINSVYKWLKTAAKKP